MIELKPLSAGFGTEVLGVDLSRPLSEARFHELEPAFYDHQVLTLRAQTLSPAQFVAP